MPLEPITLGPEEEASRLWSGAQVAFQNADESLVSLCESLGLGIRVAEILAVRRLQSVKEQFPGTIALQLETPAPEVDVHRDAVTEPRGIRFTEILDLLSADDLECVGPSLHRGWEDRRFSCLRSRATAREAVGMALDEETREKLLLLSAYRNRIFRYPPPIRIAPGEILDAFPALARFVETLSTLD